MESFIKESNPLPDQSVAWTNIEKSLSGLEARYDALISNITKTNADYGQQEYADAVRISKGVEQDGLLRGIAESAVLGVSLGLLTGLGMSLLGIYFNLSKRGS